MLILIALYHKIVIANHHMNTLITALLVNQSILYPRHFLINLIVSVPIGLLFVCTKHCRQCNTQSRTIGSDLYLIQMGTICVAHKSFLLNSHLLSHPTVQPQLSTFEFQSHVLHSHVCYECFMKRIWRILRYMLTSFLHKIYDFVSALWCDYV